MDAPKTLSPEILDALKAAVKAKYAPESKPEAQQALDDAMQNAFSFCDANGLDRNMAVRIKETLIAQIKQDEDDGEFTAAYMGQ